MRATLSSAPYDDLVVWLEDHDVPYLVTEHPETFTAAATARADHVDPRTFAKVVGLCTADGVPLLAVVDASDEVDLAAVAAHLGVASVRLLAEDELAALTPSCEVGSAPPIPELVGVEVIADEAVRADRFISFNAGTHRHSVRVDRAAWDRAAGIRYAAIARRRT